jgi:hypothetical protein
MKNRGEDAYKMPNRCITTELFFMNTIVITINKKILHSSYEICRKIIDQGYHFFKYITSFTSFTVRETSGKAAATRLGA